MAYTLRASAIRASIRTNPWYTDVVHQALAA